MLLLNVLNNTGSFLYPKQNIIIMTNILIPTDFSTKSLQLAEQAIQSLETKAANIIFFHAFEMPGSAFDLLVPGRKKPYADLMTDELRQACKQLKDQYPKSIQKICFKFMEGSTVNLFRNFVDANEVDLIVCPDHYQFNPVHKLSVDPKTLFKKSGIKVIREFGQRKKDSSYEIMQKVTPVLLATN